MEAGLGQAAACTGHGKNGPARQRQVGRARPRPRKGVAAGRANGRTDDETGAPAGGAASQAKPCGGARAAKGQRVASDGAAAGRGNRGGPWRKGRAAACGGSLPGAACACDRHQAQRSPLSAASSGWPAAEACASRLQAPGLGERKWRSSCSPRPTVACSSSASASSATQAAGADREDRWRGAGGRCLTRTSPSPGGSRGNVRTASGHGPRR